VQDTIQNVTDYDKILSFSTKQQKSTTQTANCTHFDDRSNLLKKSIKNIKTRQQAGFLIDKYDVLEITLSLR